MWTQTGSPLALIGVLQERPVRIYFNDASESEHRRGRIQIDTDLVSFKDERVVGGDRFPVLCRSEGKGELRH